MHAGILGDIQQPCRRLLVPGKLECRDQQLVSRSLGADPRVPPAVRAGLRSSRIPRPNHLLTPAVWAGSDSADNPLACQSDVDPHAYMDAILALPAWQDWIADAKREPWFLGKYEAI